MKKLVILGHGYVAGFLTPLMREAGWQVIGTTRSDVAPLLNAGAEPVIWDTNDADVLRETLAGADAVLSSVPPIAGVDPIPAMIGTAAPAWSGYLSSTSVYGDAGGAWVDEDSPTNPTSQRGQARLDAEAAWTACAEANGSALHIFRLAGIYGVGRGPFTRLENGTARRIEKAGQVFSRIHAEDIAQAIAMAIAAPKPGSLWNLADDQPAPPQDVIEAAALMADMPVPPLEAYEGAGLGPAALAFYADNRRISNRRIKDELGWSPRYPTYREGLSQILEKQQAG